MLCHLSISHLVTIDALSLEFHPGLNILTGETGAGKSILLDALSLVLGERSDTSLVRESYDHAVVSTHFDGVHELSMALDEHGIHFNNDIFIRRIVDRKGKNRQFINDHPVTLSSLKTVASQLVEIHGQFDRLFHPHQYRDALDAFGDYQPLLKEVTQNYKTWQHHQKSYQDFLNEHTLDEYALEKLLSDIKDLTALNLLDNEEHELVQEHELLSKTQKDSNILNHAVTLLDGPQSVYQTFYELEKIFNKSTDETLLKRLHTIMTETTDLKEILLDGLNDISANPHRLENIEERLMTIRQACKKYKIPSHELKNYLISLEEKLRRINQREGMEIDFIHAVKESFALYQKNAMLLSEARKATAKQLSELIQRELPDLKLNHAHFSIAVDQMDERDFNSHGCDRVDFLFSANPGHPLKSLGKTASGGELSRLMLALKVVLSKTHSLTTIIFDEIDTGVGGAVAASIGQKLKRLAKDRQIIVITHSPQVAAFGDHHYYVYKKIENQQTHTSVTMLKNDDRVEEIARMLSGDSITDEARTAAKTLLDSSQ